MKSLYDVIPENLFSVLVSPNKNLYVKALFVLLDVFKIQLQIKKSELIEKLIDSLYDDIINADFSDEELLENEQSLSGRAHFIVRKLKNEKWIIINTEADFTDYVTLPNYSIKIIQLLYDLSDCDEQENFTFVYSTYSLLETANKSRNLSEVYTALTNSVSNTERLEESLKSTYHNITYYHEQLLDTLDVNSVLSQHYDSYMQNVSEKILKPLKIRESIPKYKLPIEMILKSWLIDDELITVLTELSFQAGKFDSKELCRSDILQKIYYIIDTYNNLERNYIRVIDDKNRQYTRATTQKIDYLLNSDQSVKGNLISLMKLLSNKKTADKTAELLEDSFELYRLSFVSEDGLYSRKQGVRHSGASTVEIDESDVVLDKKTREAMRRLLENKYSKRNVRKFVNELLADRNEVSISEAKINDDEAYIMTLFSVVYSKDKDSDYTAEINDGSVVQNTYTVPNIVYRRRNGK